jgi:hypothetical protein
MEKKSILSLFLAPNLCERMEKNPSSHSILAPNLRERTEKKIHPLIWQLRLLPILILVLPSYLSDHHILAKGHCWEHSFMLLVL